MSASDQMPVLLDTNVVIRYLTGDPPDMARRARALIEGPDEVVLSGVAVAEIAYVMRTVYGAEREPLLAGIQRLVRRANVRVLDAERAVILEALDLCRGSNRVSVADALIWATATAHTLPVATFDRRFPRMNITVIEPPTPS